MKVAGVPLVFNHGKLELVMHDDPQIQRICGDQFVGVEHPFQYEDWRPDARCPEHDGLIEERNGKSVGEIAKRLSASHSAMSIRIRLDHR